MDRYRCVVLKDVYAKWQMGRDWRKPWVRDAFVDLQELIATRLTSPPSAVGSFACQALDAELYDLLERHAKGDRALYQGMFVALILDALQAKASDAYACKSNHLLTYGYRSPLLAFLVASILEENLAAVMALYENERSRADVLAFFDL